MNSRSSSKWGIAILILSQCAVSTTDAVTLWHNQKDNFKDYYQRKFYGSSGMFGDTTAASGDSPLNVRGGDTASSCDSTSATSSITATKRQKQHRSPRFSILSKRQPIIPIDCCTDCSTCMSISSLETYNCHDALSSIPRGGHLHHTHDGSSSATSAANVLADTLLDNTSPNAASELINTATPYGIPLNIWKIIFQAMLTTINVVCWLLPLKSKKISENKLGLSIANAFSGGVFLSLAFGHLIPECVEGFHGVKSSSSGTVGSSILSNEALPYMIVLSGYLLIFFVEKVAFDAHDIMHEMESGGNSSHDSHTNKKEKKNGAPLPSLTTKESSGFTGSSAVILLGALGVHSILEMTALGLADTFGDSALLSLSIALHQPAESIALLVAFLKSGMPKPQIVQFLSVFSCMGPIGVAIGMAGKWRIVYIVYLALYLQILNTRYGTKTHSTLYHYYLPSTNSE